MKFLVTINILNDFTQTVTVDVAQASEAYETALRESGLCDEYGDDVECVSVEPIP